MWINLMFNLFKVESDLQETITNTKAAIETYQGFAYHGSELSDLMSETDNPKVRGDCDFAGLRSNLMAVYSFPLTPPIIMLTIHKSMF